MPRIFSFNSAPASSIQSIMFTNNNYYVSCKYIKTVVVVFLSVRICVQKLTEMFTIISSVKTKKR